MSQTGGVLRSMRQPLPLGKSHLASFIVGSFGIRHEHARARVSSSSDAMLRNVQHSQLCGCSPSGRSMWSQMTTLLVTPIMMPRLRGAQQTCLSDHLRVPPSFLNTVLRHLGSMSKFGTICCCCTSPSVSTVCKARNFSTIFVVCCVLQAAAGVL